MTILEQGMGICQRPENRGDTRFISAWEGRRVEETAASVRSRHEEARVRCLSCPLLDACETALRDYERLGLPVDGIMAARYCITSARGAVCWACGARMRPDRTYGPVPADRRPHAGEGLCTGCHPVYARAARVTGDPALT